MRHIWLINGFSFSYKGDIKMEVEFTNRGFAKVSFSDCFGIECSLQESSLATDSAIWLGANKIGLKYFKAYQGGWKDMPEVDEFQMNEHYSANNKMHLTQAQVKELLPFLIRFAETGVISSE